MLEVINCVCARRLEKINTAFESDNHGVSTTIRLSEALMDAFAKDVADLIDSGLEFKRNQLGFDITYFFQGTPWLIRNRSYRDDTNDRDVEEELVRRDNLVSELKEALSTCYSSLCTYGPHPIIAAQVDKVLSKYYR